jgi:PAS domain S-box-containing protein
MVLAIFAELDKIPSERFQDCNKISNLWTFLSLEVFRMTAKPSYEELAQRVKDLEHSRSEHNLIEETLRKSEEKYSRLFHNSNDGIFIHDLEGNILDANQKVLELFGYTKAEISGIKIPMLHPADALEKSKWAFETILRDGFVRFEVDFKKKNGALFPAEVSSSLFETGGHEVIQGIVGDITFRKLAEQALQDSEDKYRLLADHSADIIYKINIETEQYTYISPSIKKVLGYTVEEGLALKAQDTVTEASYKEQRERLLDAIANNRMDPEILELEAIHKEGHTLPVETHANFILDEQGNPVEILGVVRDISKQKKMEEEREKLIQHLQEALKEIKTLRGILPICSVCKKIRDDKGYWNQIESYIHEHSEAEFSHGICPECAKNIYLNYEIDPD